MNDYELRKHFANWISLQEWNVFGTLTFATCKKPSLPEAERHWSRFWHKVDRLCYGQSRGNQQRLERFVFTHVGAGGDNHHIHFLAKACGDTKEFCILLNALWAGLEHANTAVPEQNEILPLISKHHASWYLLHEGLGDNAQGFNTTLSNRSANEFGATCGGMAKLRQAADRGGYLQDASVAYEKQLARAQQRHIQRTSK
jgi:hypothetical protein